MSDDTDFPVAFGDFAKLLEGTDDEVWTLWLKQQHGREKHTVTQWRAVLDQHRNQPGR